MILGLRESGSLTQDCTASKWERRTWNSVNPRLPVFLPGYRRCLVICQPSRLRCALICLYSLSQPLPVGSDIPSLLLEKQLGQDSPPTLVPALSSEHCRAGDPGLIFGKGLLMELFAKPDTLPSRLQIQGPTASEAWFFGVMEERSFDPRLCLSFSQNSKFGCFSSFHQSPQDGMKPSRKQSLVAASSSIVGDDNLG